MRTRPALLALMTITACATGPAVVTPIASLAPPTQSAAETLLALNALCSAEALGADGFAPDIKLAGGMGSAASRSIAASPPRRTGSTTASPSATPSTIRTPRPR